MVEALKKGRVMVDSECSNANEFHVFEEVNKIWCVTLNQPGLQGHANKFYIIQILQSDTDSERFFLGLDGVGLAIVGKMP